MSFWLGIFERLPVLARILDPKRAKSLLKKLTGNDTLPPSESVKVLKNMMHRKIDLNIESNSGMKVYSNLGRVIKVQGLIKREDLQANPNVTFLFGDNVKDHQKTFAQRLGKGGQAAEMAGEPNAVGIPTLWKAPDGTDQSAYFSDTGFEEIKAVIDKAFAQIKPGMTIVVPVDDHGNFNLGTGIAQLKEGAPSVLKYIESKIQALGVHSVSAGLQTVESPRPKSSAANASPRLALAA